MRRVRTAAFVLSALLLAGCATSLQQVAPDNGTVFDRSLLGTWEVVDKNSGSPPVVITSADHQNYEISVRDKDKPITYVCSLRLFRIDGNLFFDFAVSRAEVNGAEINLDDIPVMPVHFFGRIWIQPDEVRVSVLSSDWLSKNLVEKNVTLQHLPLQGRSLDGQNVILTASPEEIRDFAAKYADNKDAFGDPGVFRRKK